LPFTSLLNKKNLDVKNCMFLANALIKNKIFRRIQWFINATLSKIHSLPFQFDFTLFWIIIVTSA